MNRNIKVLIIDNNILVRRAVTSILNKYDYLDTTWVTDDSADIEEVIGREEPDVVLLSIDNMESRGLTLLGNFRKKFPALPVVVISPRSPEGGEAVITALRYGAVDFVTKPMHKNLILFAERHLRKRLEPLIRVASKIHERQNIDEDFLQSLIHPQKMFEHLTEEPEACEPADVVVIGGCTGGVKSLFTLLSDLPQDLGVPIIIVQHLPRTFTKILAEKLDANSSLMVREATNGVALEAGDVWVAPGGYHCEISQAGYQNVLNTHRGLRENNMRPSIDILFRSAVHVYGKHTLGILMSGCGQDGLAGAEEIKRGGGQVIVQHPRTAIAPELPLSVIRDGLTREYYPPEELANEIMQRTQKTAVGTQSVNKGTVMGDIFDL
ncbi:MAG: chemotaxis protein CheB [Balneolaceae bacterium]|jgi:two-component system chemotaxis response regulator CheB